MHLLQKFATHNNSVNGASHLIIAENFKPSCFALVVLFRLDIQFVSDKTIIFQITFNFHFIPLGSTPSCQAVSVSISNAGTRGMHYISHLHFTMSFCVREQCSGKNKSSKCRWSLPLIWNHKRRWLSSLKSIIIASSSLLTKSKMKLPGIYLFLVLCWKLEVKSRIHSYNPTWIQRSLPWARQKL